MKVEEFFKTWVTNFPESERKEYERAIKAQNDACLFISPDAYSFSDQKMTGYLSIHYTGKGYLDNFWNTLLDLKPVEKVVPVKKKRSTSTKKKVSRKKATPKKKTATIKKRTNPNKATLLTF